MSKNEGLYPAPTRETTKELDSQIERLQKKSGSFGSFFNTLQLNFKKKLNSYNSWRQNSWANTFHWMAVFGVVALVSLAIIVPVIPAKVPSIPSL